jgi:hypothetical protein
MKAIAVALTLALFPQFALAWGDDGHKVVALIAEHYLTPDARNTVSALLAQDTDPLTAHDIASEATAPRRPSHRRSPTVRSLWPPGSSAPAGDISLILCAGSISVCRRPT